VENVVFRLSKFSVGDERMKEANTPVPPSKRLTYLPAVPAGLFAAGLPSSLSTSALNASRGIAPNFTATSPVAFFSRIFAGVPVMPI
jgi:hypothetical protein